VRNSKESTNPFYLLCVAAGVIFTVTACAEGLVMLRANRGFNFSDANETMHPLMNLLEQHGLAILGVEVAILGLGTFAAISLDHFRGKRQLRNRDPNRSTDDRESSTLGNSNHGNN
jgi:hypothetical protein